MEKKISDLQKERLQRKSSNINEMQAKVNYLNASIQKEQSELFDLIEAIFDNVVERTNVTIEIEENMLIVKPIN